MSQEKEVRVRPDAEFIEKYFHLHGRPIKLYPYQRKFLEDESVRRIVLKSRQTGFSTIIALEALIKCLKADTTVLIISVGERQALEIVHKIKKYLVRGEKLIKEGVKLFDIVRETKKEIIFGNGARIISLPNNPSTARGYTADHVYLDECAHLERAEEIFMAIEPSLSRGGKLTLISTPAGKQGRFFDIWDDIDGKYSDYSRHKVHWNMCPDKNYQKEIKKFKENMDDFSFAQEYELQFLTEGMSYFPPGVVNPCVVKGLSQQLSSPKNYVQFGVDVGKVSSNTALVVAEKRELVDESGNKAIMVSVRRIVLWKLGTDYELIKSDIKAMISLYSPVRINVDSTGVGEIYAEDIRKEVGAIIMPTKFSQPMKERMFTQLKTLFQNGEIEIPHDTILLGQLYGFERKISEISKAVTYKGKHDDIVMALALSTLDLARPAPNFSFRAI